MAVTPLVPHDDLILSLKVVEGEKATYVLDLLEPITLIPTAPPIVMHKGSPAEGWHGWTTAHAISALIMLTESHQRTPFACAENAEMIAHLQAALDVTKKRATARADRGVLYDHKAP